MLETRPGKDKPVNEFSVKCPYCRADNADPFEVFALEAVDWTHCVACGEPFSFALLDCDACGEEGVFTWPSASEGLDLKALNCPSCHVRYGKSDEAAAEHELPDRY